MKKLLIIIALIYLYQGLYYTKAEVVSKLSLYERLIAAEIRYPAAVYAQAAHETDGFTSPIYRECKNIVGMKVAYQRPTTALGWCRNHAGYANYDDAIEDYKIWQDKYLPRYERNFGRVASNKEYLVFLKRQGYAEDPDYRRKVARYIDIIEKAIPSSSLTARGEIKH